MPAILIVLGFFAHMSGYAMNAVIHDAGMMNGGILMMVVGVVLYIVEKIAFAYSNSE